MKELYTPRDEIELSVFRTLLNSEGIPYFVRNHYFGSPRIGPPIPAYNEKVILVEERDWERASELLEDFLKQTRDEEPAASSYTMGDKARMAIEWMLSGWFVPGRPSRRSHHTDSDDSAPPPS